MKLIVAVLGVFQMLFAVSLFGDIASVMHQIFAAVVFGSGSICISIFALIATIEKRNG